MANNGFRYLTAVQLKYYANLLNLRLPKWEDDSTNDVLVAAKIDPIPHQVEAAQFAFRNPFLGGVILADEVGLGKTIEAGLVLSQYWAEGKRQILVIAPKAIRHQWQDELLDLFYLNSDIIDTLIFAKMLKGLSKNPFENREKIIITNEQFVVKHSNQIAKVRWDLVIIDEAHKFRNVWKTGKNEAKRAKVVRATIRDYKKLLLTATPIQNNLMELFGLCSFIDQYILGTVESFKKNFLHLKDEERQDKLDELKSRLNKFFKRELRKNVQTFIPYTDRHAITIPFDPTDGEEELRTKFENYLRNSETVALPAISSGFLRLVYLKLLSSSSFALSNSLLNLYVRLIHHSVMIDNPLMYDSLLTQFKARVSAEVGNADLLDKFKKTLFKDCGSETYDELNAVLQSRFNALLPTEEEIASYFDDDDLNSGMSPPSFSAATAVEAEADLILTLILLCRSLTDNSKGKALTKTIEQQFRKAKENNWPEKAVIFTEFKTTQEYVAKALQEMGLKINEDIVIFNGSINSAEDRRNLVEDFRAHKKIFLTTEAGAEGLNLQFCNLIINYDLPWNPQRIEQRIGRCHRYGQKLDVVVVNFVNRKNIADQRILQLLTEKFQLFEGAFGASNTVLGQIESGTDIEKAILNIYLTCRNENEIEAAFEALMNDNSELREAKFEAAREIIQTTFDEEVQKKLKSTFARIKESLDVKERLVKDIVLSSITSDHTCDGTYLVLAEPCRTLVPHRKYSLVRDKASDHVEFISFRHSFIREIAFDASVKSNLIFEYSRNHNIASLKPYVGISGHFILYKTIINGIDTKEILVPVFRTEKKHFLSLEDANKLIGVTATESQRDSLDIEEEELFQRECRKMAQHTVTLLQEYNERLYAEEIEKLDTYFDDLQEMSKREIDEIEQEITVLKNERRKVRLDEQRNLNLKIQKLKNDIIKKEEEITQYRRENAAKEKDRIRELNEKSETNVEIVVLAKGSFKLE